MGGWLRDTGYVPDLVVCSTSERTRQTWNLVAPELAITPAVRYEPRLYGASELGLLMLIRELPEDRGAALFVGHNPAIGELAVALPGESPMRFPTASVAVLRIPDGWASVVPGEASQLALASPRSIREQR